MSTKEFFSLKNLVTLVSISIILSAYFTGLRSSILMLIVAGLSFFLGLKIKNNEAIRYSVLAWSSSMVGYFILDAYGSFLVYTLYPSIIAIAILGYGIYKSCDKTYKLDLIIETVLITLMGVCQRFFDKNFVVEVLLFSIPFLIFLVTFVLFLIESCKETNDSKTRISCFLAIGGSVVNLLFFVLYVAFAICLPDDHSGIFGFIPHGVYPFYDFCTRTMEQHILLFVWAGLAMGAYHYFLGKRTFWKLSKLCISGIIGLFGFGVFVAFLSGNMSEYVVGLSVQDVVPIIYYISTSLIVYSNVNFIKIL